MRRPGRPAALPRRRTFRSRAPSHRRFLALCGLAFAGLLVAVGAEAHEPSDSRLTLELGPGPPVARWDIALRDLDFALGLDADGDGAITWGELGSRRQAIAEHAFSRLALTAAGKDCSPRATAWQAVRHDTRAYAVLRFDPGCPGGRAPTALRYGLFFELDPTHRGIVTAARSGSVETAVLTRDRPGLTLGVGYVPWWLTFVSYWREGLRHVPAGLDHLLFLLTLLLPAVLARRDGAWRPAASPGPVLVEVTGVVTAFTVAHSLTLCLAVLGAISVPSRLVEPAIAATVLVAAVNNLHPLWTRRRWLAAFLLGLVHGLGFAGVLTGVGLPAGALAAALAGFNLGVEAAQLAVVLAVVPFAYLVRGGWVYHRVGVQLGSLAVAVVAAGWLVERTLAAVGATG